MNYERTVTEFLAQPENLPVALEIAGLVDRVKDYLLDQFWTQFAKEMERRLQPTDLLEKWQVNPPEQGRRLEPYTTYVISDRQYQRNAMHVRIALQAGQPRAGYPLCYGLTWSRPYQEGYESPLLAETRQTLLDLGFTSNSEPWWPVRIPLKYSLRDDQFLVRFSAEPERVIAEISDTFWDFFEKVRDCVAEVNKVLSNSSG